MQMYGACTQQYEAELLSHVPLIQYSSFPPFPSFFFMEFN